MTKKYSILQKKLQDLEEELNKVLSLPPETPCHQLLSEGMEQRFLFMKKLLLAETASHPKKPHHLQHIAQRLDELEAAFHDWDDFKTSALPDRVDADSTCSCTESCLNDDGDASNDSGSRFYKDPEMVSGEVVEEEAVKVEPERVERREKGRVWIGGYGGVMASTVMVGVVLMGFLMVRFSGCFYYMGHEFVLTPT